MRYRVAALGAAVAVFLIGWRVHRAAHAAPAPAAIPFVDGAIIRSFGDSGVTLVARQTDGTYLPLQIGLTAPYSLLSSVSAAMQWVTGGIAPLAAGSAGPAGVGRASQVVTAADLTGSGSIGGVMRGPGGNTAIVYQASSSILFQTLTDPQKQALAKTYTIGPGVSSFYFADFNHDSKPDLAVSFNGGLTFSGGIAVLLNRGDGTFGTPSIYAPGSLASRFAVSDVNHDGNLDIVAATQTQALIVLLGTANGTFGSPGFLSANGSSGQAITIADFDGDGNPDLAVGGSSGILLGDGAGNFTTKRPFPPAASTTYITAIAAGDLNGDGKLDLVCIDNTNQVALPLYGKGDATFRQGQAYAIGQFPDSVVLADYNHDGRLDIINGNGDARAFGPSSFTGNADILINNGDETFQGAPTYISLPDTRNTGFGFTPQLAMITGNFGGKNAGVLSAGFGGNLALLIGDGKGGLQAPKSFTLPAPPSVDPYPSAMATADFDGDGQADVAIAERNLGGIAILLGNATTVLGTAHPIASGGIFPVGVVAADFDGDGKVDLATLTSSDLSGAGASPGRIGFLKGNGDGTFKNPVTINVGQTPTSLAAADVNGDGLPDLIYSDSGQNFSGGGVFVSLNHAGVFQAPQTVIRGSGIAFAVADVDGDRVPDMVLGSSIFVYTMHGNGDGTFSGLDSISTSNANISALLVQDFNGDGAADIVLAHPSTETTFMAGGGDGTFSAETYFLGGAAPQFLATADLNGDGKPDLISGGSNVTVLLNNAPPVVTTVNSANFGRRVAAGSIVSGFGSSLAVSPMPAGAALTTQLNGTTVTLTDSAGAAQQCLLFFVGPSQVNYLIPSNAALGAAQISVRSGDGTVTLGPLNLFSVAPGLYSADGKLASALVVRADQAGNQTATVLVNADSTGKLFTTPINLDPSTDVVFLELYGTGIRNATLSQVSLQIGGQTLQPAYAGPAPGYPGEDQINVQLPHSLKGSGDTTITLTAAGLTSNAVHVQIQ